MIRVHLIFGCTATGKAKAGLEVANRLGAEIVSVDSMKVYRRMDIGTAKPSPAVRQQVPHHCLDLVEPSESFSVARYIEHADKAIADISSRGRPILVVGGTALYIKALTEGLFEGPGGNPAVRQAILNRAAALGLPALHAELARHDPPAAARIHPNDEKRIVRALEVLELTGQPISRLQRQWDQQRRYDAVMIGLRLPRADANHRINARVKRMVEAGLRDEVAALLAEPAGLSPQAAQALGYAEMIRHLRGEWTLEQATEQIKVNTRQFAKHQRTWFRRFANVHWLDLAADETAQPVVERILPLIGV